MKLDIGSLAFNLLIEDGGGTPSWGTALGQNSNYNYTMPGIEELLTSMVYCTTNVNNVFCPLGKGGNQQQSYSYEIAGVYEKVYANNALIPNAKFILLIVKKVEGDFHVGRRTLKYSPNITYKDEHINEDCFKKIANTLGISEDGSWMVHSISTKNQDELHFEVVIADFNNAIIFNNTEERKKFLLDLLKKNNIDLETKGNELEEKDLRTFYIDNLRNNDYVKEMIKQREKFLLEYPLQKLLTLSYEEYCLGLEGYRDSFCNKLEKGEYSRTGFGIGGANASKFGMYFKKDGKFHGKNDVEIENPDTYWENYRKQLYDFIVKMGTNAPDFSIDEKYNLLGGSGGYMYLTKLLSLYYPDRFIAMSKPDAYDKLTKYLNIQNRENAVVNSYYSNIAFREYAPEANNNFGYYISNSIWKFFKMDEKEVSLVHNVEKIEESSRLMNAYNKIYYGIPGCGKSWIANDFAMKSSKDDSMIVRTTFYPDYSNSDFVGQIIPKIDEIDSNSVLYDIQGGPFTEAMVKAIDNPNKYVCLIVEEINRGNAAAIFGDLFQLLDRNQNGTSEYWIKNYTITEYLKKHCLNKIYDLEHIRIPSNLYIIGTMNTSDQNVFTLDTAFKRRWNMEHISNDVNKSKYKDKVIPILNIKWYKFVESINDLITQNSDDLGINGEDKQIGSYFISGNEWDKMDEFIKTNNQEEAAKIFAEKVLSYLWEDVTKLDKNVIFKNEYYTFDKLVRDFINNKDVLNITDVEE